MTLIWTTAARQARLDIIRHIAQDDPDAAVIFNREITQKAQRLATFPNLGRIGRVQGTRELLINSNYILIYKVGESVVSIVNILHAAQKYP